MVNEKYKKLDKFIKNSMKKCWRVPGISITIFNSNEILYKYVGGYSNLQTKSKLKITDKFCIASCSKSILCAAISSLIEKRKIPNIWNMTLEEVWSKNIHKDYKKVTVKKIASHCSGIPGHINNDNCEKYYTKVQVKLNKILDGMKSREKLANLILKEEPSYPPGKSYDYSNWGYGILGAIIERLTKKNYSQIIEEEIMKPLKIDANYSLEYYFHGKNYVNGHYVDYDRDKNKKYIPLKKNEWLLNRHQSPSGKIWMSILDSTKYCQSYLKTLKKEKSILKLSYKYMYEYSIT